MHRLDLGLYSHPKEFLGGMEFEPMLTPREKSPLPKMSPEEDRTRDAVDSEPKHYQLSYSGPLTININDLRRRRANAPLLKAPAAHIRQPTGLPCTPLPCTINNCKTAGCLMQLYYRIVAHVLAFSSSSDLVRRSRSSTLVSHRRG